MALSICDDDYTVIQAVLIEPSLLKVTFDIVLDSFKKLLKVTGPSERCVLNSHLIGFEDLHCAYAGGIVFTIEIPEAAHTIVFLTNVMGYSTKAINIESPILGVFAHD